MCGRFTLKLSPELLAEIFGLQEPLAFQPRYNIAPTQQIAAIRQDADGRNRMDYLRWGLIPSWAKDKTSGSPMFNAKSETVHEKPSFRTAVRYRRCVVPASSFFEWRHERKVAYPYIIRLKDDMPMFFAGIWDHWKSPEGENIESCAVLTTTANKLVEPLHDRMPVILHQDEFDLWLNRNMHDPEKLKQLYQPYPADLMEAWQVSPLVNSPRNDSEDCVLPFTQ